MRSLHFPPMIDNDPDGHYFNDSKIITDTKYDATEFNKTVTNCTKHLSMLSETWLSEHNTSIAGFDNYSHEYNYRKVKHEDGSSKRGGGVSILVKKSITYAPILDPNLTLSNETIESLFIEVDSTPRNSIIGCIYRPPGTDLKQFNQSLESIIKRITKYNKNVYLLGDFNINLLNYSIHDNTFNLIVQL